MKTTEIKMPEAGKLWMIVRTADPKGYHTGRVWGKTELVEFENLKEFWKFYENQKIEANESEGAYVFRILAKSHPLDVLYDMGKGDDE